MQAMLVLKAADADALWEDRVYFYPSSLGTAPRTSLGGPSPALDRSCGLRVSFSAHCDARLSNNMLNPTKGIRAVDRLFAPSADIFLVAPCSAEGRKSYCSAQEAVSAIS